MTSNRNNLRTLCDHWIGGRIKHTSGYILLLKKQHRLADKDGYVFEHRYLYEKYHNCCLLKWAAIHHLNANKSDNTMQNLEAMSVGQNIKRHYTDRRAKLLPSRQCIICGSKTTTKRKTMDRYLWYFFDHNPSKPVCNSCRALLQYRGLM